MSNSNLVTVTVKSPNHSGQRTHPVTRITPHCMVGQLSAKQCGNLFLKTSYEASSNYGIGKDGEIGLYVDESHRSWCSSSSDNDNRAITIECASDAKPPYAMRTKVYNSLVKLCVDICRRYGKKKLLWWDDRTRALSYSPKEDEMVLTVHRWFASKSCPGDWLYNRLGNLAIAVTAQLQDGNAPEPAKATVMYRVQCGAFANKANAERRVHDLKAAGFDAKIMEV